MGIVEIKGMAERAVEQRGDRGRPGLAVAEHGGLALAVERQRFQHLEQRGRRFRVAPRPDRAAEEIERQHLGALQHFRRDVLEFQVGDIGGERCGFVGHRVSSLLPHRVGGLIPAFKPPCGRGHQPCLMSSITGIGLQHSGMRRMIAFLKRMLGSLAVPEGATGAGGQGHRRRRRRAYAIARGAASDAAAMGGADLAHRHPDERRPVAEGDPRLYARHGRRRDLWRRHRGADPAFRRGRIAGVAGAGGRAAGFHRRHQSQPERRHGYRRDRAAGPGDEPRQSAGFRHRPRLCEVTVGALTGLLVSFLVLPSRAVSQIRVNAARLARIVAAALCRIAGGPDARARQRRPAPYPGWHRRGAGQPPCDRRWKPSASARRVFRRDRTPARCCAPSSACATTS